MLIQPGHDLDEVAWPVPRIELKGENLVPSVFAGPRAAGKRKQVCAIRHATTGPALNRRCSDLVHRHDREDRRKGIDLLFVDIPVCLDTDIASGQAGAASRQDGIDFGIGAPGAKLLCDLVPLIGKNDPIGHDVASRFDTADKSVAGAVVLLVCIKF